MLAYRRWNSRRCPRGHHLDDQDQMLAHAQVGMERCRICEKEEAHKKDKRGRIGNAFGLFIKWFPIGGDD